MSVAPDDRSFLDRLAGVLGPNQKTQDLGLALLANSGYSTTPRSFGQVLGTSALQAQQMAAQRQNEDIKNRYMQAQMEALAAKQPGPASVQEYEYAVKNGFKGTFEEWQTKARGQNDPADVLTYKYWNSLTDQQKQDFLKLKRNVGSDFQIVDVNGVPTVVYKPGAGASATNPIKPVVAPAPADTSVPPAVSPTGAPAPASAPKGTPFTTPLSTTESEAAAAAKIAEAKSAGEAAGKGKGTAEFDLPRVERTVQQALGDIEKLKNHPGLPYITGLLSKAPVVPGTSQAAAQALADQVKGQTFLQAYQSLKGGGQITEVEGTKAEAAIARLKQAQSTKDFKSALDDLSEVLQAGLAQAKKQAGKAPPATKADPLGIR